MPSEKPAAESQPDLVSSDTVRDPEDRLVPPAPDCISEKMFDKTLADSFPTSDPPSTIPDPSAADSFATEQESRLEQQLCVAPCKKVA